MTVAAGQDRRSCSCAVVPVPECEWYQDSWGQVPAALSVRLVLRVAQKRLNDVHRQVQGLARGQRQDRLEERRPGVWYRRGVRDEGHKIVYNETRQVSVSVNCDLDTRTRVTGAMRRS